jgi:ubiquinone/menaquinone biosynthesis C-methylase UbiE
MKDKEQEEVRIQRQYYQDTAGTYNESCVHEKDEHYFALSFLLSALDYIEAKSVLDVGSGTGRALLQMKQKRPELQAVGVEPVEELRKVGYANGLSPTELIGGDATHLQFPDNQFDVVCEFGVLHHIKRPESAVAEMLRVAKKAIFISDSNVFGQGSFAVRSIKQLLNLMGLWGVADYIKTKGKGYTITEGDGLFYSYSVFNNYGQIKESCKSIHIFNTIPAGVNPYRTSGHIALLGLK